MKQNSKFFVALNSFYFRYEPKSGLELKNVDWAKNGYIESYFFDHHTFSDNSAYSNISKVSNNSNFLFKSFSFKRLDAKSMSKKSLFSKIISYWTFRYGN